MLNIFFIFFILIYTASLNAQTTGTETGLKLPRYVSLKSNESNLRIGSSKNYPIKLKYVIPNTPIEIIEEYQDWRKILDFDGNEGWLHKSLIKGNRFAIINSSYQERVQIFNKPRGRVVGSIGNRNIVKLNKCLKDWCHIKFNQYSGWIIKLNLWGVYRNELFKIPFYQPIINKLWEIKINLI